MTITKEQLEKLDKYDWRLSKITDREKPYQFKAFKDLVGEAKNIEAKTPQEMATKVKKWIETL